MTSAAFIIQICDLLMGESLIDDNLDTSLPELTDVTLTNLRHIPPEQLTDINADIRATAKHSRKNLGSSGPPGRSD
jgi:hypothetical protein